MAHIYLTVVCKTPGCRTRIDFRHLDYLGDTPSGKPIMRRLYASIETECPKCSTLHTYTDDNLEQDYRDHPPAISRERFQANSLDLPVAIL
jgi:hypothetical protein